MTGFRATSLGLGLTVGLLMASGAAAQGAAPPDGPPPGAGPAGAGLPPHAMPQLPPYEPVTGGPAEAPNRDPHDFSGIWYDKPVNPLADFSLGAGLPLNAEAQAVYAHRLAMTKAGTPVASAHLTCRPTGIDATLHPKATVTVVQSPQEIVFITEEDRNVRRIRLNQRHPAHIVPSYMGDSVGHWEGDTLVVDTVGFNGMGWLDERGTPQSDQLHVVERISKSADGSRLLFNVTITDPKTFTQPVSVNRTWAWSSGGRPQEYSCEENPSGLEIMTFDNEAFRPICVMEEGVGDAPAHIVCRPPKAK